MENQAVNMNYLLSAEDIRMLTLVNPPKSKTAKWSSNTPAFANDGSNTNGHQDLKKEIEALAPGHQLLIPVNLVTNEHWVTAICEKDAQGKISITWMDSLPWALGGIRPAIEYAHSQLKALFGKDIPLITPAKEQVLIQTNENPNNKTSCGDCVIANATSYADKTLPPKITMENLRREHAEQLDDLGLNFSQVQRVNAKDDLDFTLKTIELEPKLAFANKIRSLSEKEKDSFAAFLKQAVEKKYQNPEDVSIILKIAEINIPFSLKEEIHKISVNLRAPKEMQKLWEIIEKVDPQFPRSPKTIEKQIASDEALARKLQQEEYNEIKKSHKPDLANKIIENFSKGKPYSPDNTPNTRKTNPREQRTSRTF